MSLVNIFKKAIKSSTLNKCNSDKGEWADLVVVCHNIENDEMKLGVFDDNPHTLTNCTLMTKEKLIEEIQENEKTAITAYIESGNCFRKGALLHVVADAYVRTDMNKIEEDNLGELPTCDEFNLV